jgi:hypothetical protein
LTSVSSHCSSLYRSWPGESRVERRSRIFVSRSNWKGMHDQGTDDRLYQMNHCVSIPMIFVSAIFARLSRQMTRATLPKWRLLPKCVIAHVSWRGLHLLPKWRPTRVLKNRGHNFSWVIHLVLSIICARVSVLPFSNGRTC